VYLAAVVDWFSRRVLAWKLSITLEVEFFIEAVEEALTRYGKPEIFNTDQGSQFTSGDFTGLLLQNRIAISMDGKAAWHDNVFVERLWRSVRYEEVYLHAYANVAEARTGLGRYLTFTMARARIRALAHARRTKPTSPRPRCLRRPEKIRDRCLGLAPVGLRPPCARPRYRHTTHQPGRGSTYIKRNGVQTNPATSRLLKGM
jgi:transposase InsO family protein